MTDYFPTDLSQMSQLQSPSHTTQTMSDTALEHPTERFLITPHARGLQSQMGVS